MDYKNYWLDNTVFTQNNWTKCNKLLEKIVLHSPPNSVFIELGTYLGRSAALWASHILVHKKQQKVITIDHHYNDGQFERATSNLKPLVDIGVVELIKSDSIDPETLGKFKDGSIQAIFIDAGHRYNNLLLDVRAWWPKMSPGAIVCGDDYITREVDNWPKKPWEAGPELPILHAMITLFSAHLAYAPEGWPLWLVRKAGGTYNPVWDLVPEIANPK